MAGLAKFRRVFDDSDEGEDFEGFDEADLVKIERDAEGVCMMNEECNLMI